MPLPFETLAQCEGGGATVTVFPVRLAKTRERREAELYTPCMPDCRHASLLEWCNDRSPVRVSELEPLATEASTRSFWRVHSDLSPRTWIVMDSPPDSENNRQFVALARVFKNEGVPVPEVYAFDAERGFLLVEDFGNRLFLNEYPRSDQFELIKLAVSTLAGIQRVEDAAIPPYEQARFHMELDIFRQWTCGAMLELASQPLNQIEQDLVEAIFSQPRCTVHRDFHSRNLLLRTRPGPRATENSGDLSIGIVDFQDALVGPCTYDLASFAFDCYWEFAPREIEHCFALGWQALPLAQRRQVGSIIEFRRMTEHVALQRMLKAVGIFCRLLLQRQRDSHVRYVVPVLQRAGTLALNHPSMSNLGRWLLDCVAPAAQSRLE